MAIERALYIKIRYKKGFSLKKHKKNAFSHFHFVLLRQELMAKTSKNRTLGAFQCQISNTITTPFDVSGWYPVLALNFNEDEY